MKDANDPINDSFLDFNEENNFEGQNIFLIKKNLEHNNKNINNLFKLSDNDLKRKISQILLSPKINEVNLQYRVQSKFGEIVLNYEVDIDNTKHLISICFENSFLYRTFFHNIKSQIESQEIKDLINCEKQLKSKLANSEGNLRKAVETLWLKARDIYVDDNKTITHYTSILQETFDFLNTGDKRKLQLTKIQSNLNACLFLLLLGIIFALSGAWLGFVSIGLCAPIFLTHLSIGSSVFLGIFSLSTTLLSITLVTNSIMKIITNSKFFKLEDDIIEIVEAYQKKNDHFDFFPKHDMSCETDKDFINLLSAKK